MFITLAFFLAVLIILCFISLWKYDHGFFGILTIIIFQSFFIAILCVTLYIGHIKGEIYDFEGWILGFYANLIHIFSGSN